MFLVYAFLNLIIWLFLKYKKVASTQYNVII